jgi:hypothetical protein
MSRNLRLVSILIFLLSGLKTEKKKKKKKKKFTSKTCYKNEKA